MAEAEATPLDELKNLVAEIEARKRVIADADRLPSLAWQTAELMIKKALSYEPSFAVALGLGERDETAPFIRPTAALLLAEFKSKLAKLVEAERVRIVLDESLKINALAVKIDGLSKDVARSLIVDIPAANEG